MPFRSKQGAVSLILRLKESENVSEAIDRYITEGWLLEPEKVMTSDDAQGKFLIHKEDAAAVNSRLPESKDHYHDVSKSDRTGRSRNVRKEIEDEVGRVKEWNTKRFEVRKDKDDREKKVKEDRQDPFAKFFNKEDDVKDNADKGEHEEDDEQKSRYDKPKRRF